MHLNDPKCASCGKTTPPLKDWYCSSCKGLYLLNNRYMLINQLGKGASGSTSLFKDLKRDQDLLPPFTQHQSISESYVAIKEIPWRWGTVNDKESVFSRELSTLSELNNPHIPDLIDHFFVTHGRFQNLCLVQTYFKGQSLKELNRRLSRQDVWNLAESILDILCYLHELSPPVIHRDIKPENIIALDEGGFALVDFGSVRDAAHNGEASLTWGGTFGYMAPETFLGLALPQSDLYALGALVLWMLTRKDPASLINSTSKASWKSQLILNEQEKFFLELLLHPDHNSRWNSARDARSHLRNILHTPILPISLQPIKNQQLELESTLRKVIQEELLTKHFSAHKTSPPIPTEQEPLPPTQIENNTTLEWLPKQRRGWWSARPPTPEKLKKPTHPATVLLLMATSMTLVAAMLQVLWLNII